LLPSFIARTTLACGLVFVTFAQANAMAKDCPANKTYLVNAKGDGRINIKAASFQTVCGHKTQYHKQFRPDDCGDGAASYFQGTFIFTDRSSNNFTTEADVVIVESGVYRDYGTTRAFKANDPILAGKPFVWNPNARISPYTMLSLDGPSGIGNIEGEWTIKCRAR